MPFEISSSEEPVKARDLSEEAYFSDFAELNEGGEHVLGRCLAEQEQCLVQSRSGEDIAEAGEEERASCIGILEGNTLDTNEALVTMVPSEVPQAREDIKARHLAQDMLSRRYIGAAAILDIPGTTPDVKRKYSHHPIPSGRVGKGSRNKENGIHNGKDGECTVACKACVLM